MEGLSQQLQQFIASHFDSIEALEIALLLRRSRHTYWAAMAIAEHLGIPEGRVRTKVEALHDLGILIVGEQTGAYRYAPSEELEIPIGQLAIAYVDCRASVINALYSASRERLRAFSDAFRVK